VIPVQLVHEGLDHGGKEESETIDDGILVYSTQKFSRVFVLSCKDSDEYRDVEIEANLGGRSPNE